MKIALPETASLSTNDSGGTVTDILVGKHDLEQLCVDRTTYAVGENAGTETTAPPEVKGRRKTRMVVSEDDDAVQPGFRIANNDDEVVSALRRGMMNPDSNRILDTDSGRFWLEKMRRRAAGLTVEDDEDKQDSSVLLSGGNSELLAAEAAVDDAEGDRN